MNHLSNKYAVPVKYHIGMYFDSPVYLQATTLELNKSGHPKSWKVCTDGRNVLNHVYSAFELEPNPSSRTEQFLKETRFSSKKRAISAYWTFKQAFDKQQRKLANGKKTTKKVSVAKA